MDHIDADPESTLAARLADLLGPIIEGPNAAAVAAALARLAAAPLPTLEAPPGHADRRDAPPVPFA